MDTETMNCIAKEIGKKYGYSQVVAEYNVFRDFKVKWTRSISWINFLVSDYLDSAPREVIENIFEVMFSNIANDGTVEYSQETKDYLTSAEFREMYRPRYIKRSRNLIDDDDAIGILENDFKELKEECRIDQDMEMPMFKLFRDDLRGQPQYTSTLMYTAMINKDLFLSGMEEVRKYAVLEAMLMIAGGLRRFGKDISGDTEDLEHYPNRKELEKKAKSIGIYL